MGLIKQLTLAPFRRDVELGGPMPGCGRHNECFRFIDSSINPKYNSTLALDLNTYKNTVYTTQK